MFLSTYQDHDSRRHRGGRNYMLELYAAVQLLSQAGLEWQVDQKVQFRGAHRIFYDCLKLCVNVGTTRQLWRKESRCLRLFLHMEERGNISDTCTCDDARAHTHREPKHTDTLTGTHMEISVQDSVENALPAHILRTQKCALHTHARAHARKHAPLVLHATPAVLPPHLPQVQDVKHGLKDPHTDGAAPPGGPDSPRRRWRGRGRVHRCNIRGVHRHRAPAALVAVLGA